MTGLVAGLAYFAVVFAAGFVLGTLRVLVLAPYVGETGAVLAELPVMLALSWLVCGGLIRRLAVPGEWRHRLAMGGVAFVLLMVAELAVSVLAFGRTPAEHLETYRSWNAALGLAAQLAFAAFPLVRGRASR
jgi:ABC-type uncharacterized transport system permease subunit